MGKPAGKTDEAIVASIVALGKTKREQKKIAVIWKLMDMFDVQDVFGTLERDRILRKERRSKKVTANNHRMWAARRRVWEASLERDADKREQTPGARTINGWPVDRLAMIRERGKRANEIRHLRQRLKKETGL